MKAKSKKPFLWIPGEGSDSAALYRMYEHFPRPAAPMGEAWFMGDKRRMFDHLATDASWRSDRETSAALFEIASGTRSFGERREWTEWFHFLLAEEMPGAMFGSIDAPLVEALATAYFSLYPLGVEREPYRGFARDSLDTLGRAIMNAQCWSRGRIERGEILRRRRTGWGSWGWDRASGDLSASMFFCLKYLPSAEIGPWLGSAFAIEDPYWRAQLMVWFVGAHDMLTGKMRQPHEFPDDMRPCIAWEYSHILSGADCGATTKATATPFLPEANRAAAHAAVVAFFDDETFLNWLCAICEDEQLESELAELPETFAALYLG